MEVEGAPDERISSDIPVNQCRDYPCPVGLSAFRTFIPHSVGFEASATPYGLYFKPGGMIGSGHNNTTEHAMRRQSSANGVPIGM